MKMYYFVLAILIFAFCLIHRTIHSPFGQVLKAIRENEARALSLGYDVNRYKLLAFVLSTGLAGLAGATKCVVLQFVTLTDVDWHTSGDAVLMTLLGGVGTVLGPLVGAWSIVTLETQLAERVGSLVGVIVGVIFIICVLVFRKGVVGEIASLYRRTVGTRP